MKWFKIFLASIVCILVLGLGVQQWVQHKINAFIANDLPPSVKLNESNIQFKLWSKTISCRPMQIIYDADSTDNYATKLIIENIDFKGINYYQLWANNKVVLDDLIFKNSTIIHHKLNKKKKNTEAAQKQQIPVNITVDKFQLDAANLHIVDNTGDSTVLKVDNLNLILREVEVNEQTLSNNLPFHFSASYCSYDSLMLKAGKHEHLVCSYSQLKNENLIFNNLSYFTKYSKETYSKILDLERDHVRLTVDDIRFTNFNFENSIERRFAFTADSVHLQNPFAKMYRDKTIADDLRPRILYGEKMNNALVDLDFKNVLVVNGFLHHDIHKDINNTPGKLKFNNIYSTIQNFSNVNQEPTTISFQAKFMEDTKVEGDWSFVNSDLDENFIFNASINSLTVADLNQLTIPNQNSKMSGNVSRVNIKINGNKFSSVCDLEIDYQDLKITLLDEEDKKRKLVSAIANFIIRDDGTIPDEKHGKINVTTTRETTISFWKYIWLNIKAALAEDIIKL